MFNSKKKYLKKHTIRKLLLKKLELNMPKFKGLPISELNMDRKDWNSYYND